MAATSSATALRTSATPTHATRMPVRPLKPVASAAAAAKDTAATSTSSSSTFKLPTDAAGVRAAIAKSHEVHGQGKALWFHFEGRGRRGTVSSYGSAADLLASRDPSKNSMVSSYDIFS